MEGLAPSRYSNRSPLMILHLIHYAVIIAGQYRDTKPSPKNFGSRQLLDYNVDDILKKCSAVAYTLCCWVALFWVCVYVRARARVCVRMFVYMYMSVCECVCVLACVCVSVCMSVCVRMCVCFYLFSCLHSIKVQVCYRGYTPQLSSLSVQDRLINR